MLYITVNTSLLTYLLTIPLPPAPPPPIKIPLDVLLATIEEGDHYNEDEDVYQSSVMADLEGEEENEEGGEEERYEYRYVYLLIAIC